MNAPILHGAELACISVALALLLCLRPTTSLGAVENAPSPEPIAGTWQGEFTIGDKPRPIAIEITRTPDGWTATYEGTDHQRRNFKTAQVAGAHVRLTTSGGSFFDGTLSSESLKGTYQHDATRAGPFSLVRSAPPASQPNVVGAYGADGLVTYGIAMQNGALFVGRPTDGWGRILHAQPDGSFTYGQTLLDQTAAVGRVRFGGDDTSRTMTIEEVGKPIFHGSRTAELAEEVSFASEGARLAGTLYRPAGAGPFPAVVMLHGSGPALRGDEPWLHTLVADGFAVFTYDKRGCGKSTGGTWRASFDTYAKDALAAVGLLGARPEIDPAHIGLYGPSQGGYVGLLAASQSPAVRFVMIRSTSAVTPLVQEEYRMGKLLEIHGYPSSEIVAAQEFVRAKFNAPLSGDWATYGALAEKHRGAKWFDEVGGAPAKDHPAHEFWRLNGRFDPMPLVTGLTIPILWLTPEFDEAGPARETVELLKRVEAELAHFVLPHANHGMLLASGYEITEESLAKANGYTPDFLPTIRRWLANQVQR